MVRRLSLRKRALLGSLIVLTLFLLTYTGLHTTLSVQATIQRSMATGIDLIIDYGNSSQNTYSDLTGLTVFDILNQTTTVTFTEFAYGKFIESINGVENNAHQNGHYWQYWVNDALAPVAADNYILLDGDQILWKYCAPEETITPPPTLNPDLIIGIAMIGVVGGVIVLAAVFINWRLR